MITHVKNVALQKAPWLVLLPLQLPEPIQRHNKLQLPDPIQRNIKLQLQAALWRDRIRNMCMRKMSTKLVLFAVLSISEEMPITTSRAVSIKQL